MKIRSICSALIASALIAAGCGSNDQTTSADAEADAPATIAEIEVETGPFDSDDAFTAAVDDYCESSTAVFDRYPVYGVSADGLEAEFANLVELETDDVAKVESIEAPEGLADQWADYTEADADLLSAHKDVLAAASDGDADKANQILFGPATKAGDRLRDASEALGVSCSEEAPELSSAEPGQATDAAAEAPQPANTIEAAADEYLQALQSGDCKQIVAASHTQAYADESAFADPATGDCSGQKKGFAKAEIAATSQFGPVGMAALEYAPGQFSYEDFVLDADKGDQLLHTGGLYADTNGLDPAPEGNNADEVTAAFVEAVRDNDSKALNETLTVETSPASEGGFLQEGSFDSLGNDPDYAEQIVSDIRANPEIEPVLLGANQIKATYLLDNPDGTDYLLVAVHQPGSATDYGVTAYWALPAATESGSGTDDTDA